MAKVIERLRLYLPGWKACFKRDWESVKVGEMRDAVFAKFNQHPALAALLLSSTPRTTAIGATAVTAVAGICWVGY